ncbi:DUF2267 domain-containing protein [Oharaeibacter diazotrophicus]|uniref:DUF2267 domain-containing protein n=1 Tax=Oharaeibacter diazotrophicus TaxID=1920512 RepID=A0A4R6RAV7_9HYPH|nr:DUF2267 domain-containing protein [Oharaeibacter diazotrophicus]TDP83271.1 hypothetical protein EDD54_3230 [Oharaeibacter diazotrophicus]BBE72104.1 hypothetical protein OHA_1_01691 [Pleomorphomonas sp. SM30]
MEEVIARIADAAGVETAKADRAVRIILNFLHEDGPGEKVERIAAELGMTAYLDGAGPKRGLLAKVGGLFGAGGAMAAYGALTAEGLDLPEIQRLVGAFVAIAREKVGSDTVDEVVAAIPGLAQFV